MTHPTTPRFTRSPHLVDLLADAERLAAGLARADADARAGLAVTARPEAAVASLRLDGSPLTAPPSEDLVERARARVATAPEDRAGTWFDAMRSFDTGEADEEVLALEYDGVRAALAADDLAASLLTDAAGTLATLHERLTRGLVAADRVGQLRRSDQAVHDAAIGRIIYFTADPSAVPGELASIASWLASVGAREHGLIVAGVLHHELLRIHPFEAANGRLARAAARLVLRTRGLDPDGLALVEPALADDPAGYHDEVARTIRRRDLTIGLERWGEAVTDGLRAAARSLGQLDVSLPDRAHAFVDGRGPGEAFTVADHRAEAALSPEESRTDLRSLLDAGRITRVPGSRGLRYVTASP